MQDVVSQHMIDILAHPWLLMHYSQQLRNGPRLDVHQQMKKIMVYINNVIFFSSLRKNEIKIFSLKWIELVSILLSEISQAQKDKYCIFLILCGSEI